MWLLVFDPHNVREEEELKPLRVVADGWVYAWPDWRRWAVMLQEPKDVLWYDHYKINIHDRLPRHVFIEELYADMTRPRRFTFDAHPGALSPKAGYYIHIDTSRQASINPVDPATVMASL